MRLFTAKAAASHSSANAAACSLVTAQGWNKSKSRSRSATGTMSSGCGRLANGSSAVKRAMSYAARAVCTMAASEKSDVLALPRRCPTYTVTPNDLSRLRSTFSSSPWRTDTLKPQPSDTSAAALVAPHRLAAANAVSVSDSKNARV